MSLLPEWAPNLHPLVLHFPIALLFVAAAFDAVGLFSGDRGGWRKSANWLYALGAVTAVITWYSGTLAADSVFLPTEANALLTEHADLGLWTAWFFGGYAVIRMGINATKLGAGGMARIGFFVIGLAGLGLITVTATHGAELVYRYGVGVEAVETAPSEPLVQAEAGEDGIAVSPAGWSWAPARAAAWKTSAIWVEGSAESLTSSLVDGGDRGDVFQLEVTEPTLFVLPGQIDRLQVDLALDPTDFDGSVLVAHHVQEDGSYGFTSLANDVIRLGRTENSDLLVQATEAMAGSGWRDIRVVVDGTHFRSYVDTQLLVHGHGAAFEPGQVGLRLNGTGVVRLAGMQAVDLGVVAGGSSDDSSDSGEEMDMPMDSEADDHDHEEPNG
ncbi:MAG: hypothetical protein HKN29_04330 [Rhodothermales bacterium]|nr:hypothetical protein [Rhodothermales bacterium]